MYQVVTVNRMHDEFILESVYSPTAYLELALFHGIKCDQIVAHFEMLPHQTQRSCQLQE